MKLFDSKIGIIVLMLCMSALFVSAQVGTKDSVRIDPEAEKLFTSLMPKRDSSFTVELAKAHKDKFIKRISFHFNMAEWAATLPNMGIEIDLKQTPKTSRSLILTGKANGTIKYNFNPSLIFNLQGANIEYRKYWRTGNQDETGMPLDIPKMVIKDGKKITSTTDYTTKLNEKTGQIDTIYKEVYASKADSLQHERYNGNPHRSKAYNRYLKFRRNVTSSRTIQNPRNWRAYYIGAYAGVERYNICFTKTGRQGIGAMAGMSLGWSVPLLTGRYPKEYGLDLDLGVKVGVKAVRYDAYHYDDESHCYAYDAAKSKPSFGISKCPIHEVSIGLVYRFRSISNKVSLSLVKDYKKKWVDDIASKVDELNMAQEARANEEKIKADSAYNRNIELADSASYWGDWHIRRLENALRLNPDTVFTTEDDIRLFNELLPNEAAKRTVVAPAKKGKKTTAKEEKVATKEDEKPEPTAEKPKGKGKNKGKSKDDKPASEEPKTEPTSEEPKSEPTSEDVKEEPKDEVVPAEENTPSVETTPENEDENKNENENKDEGEEKNDNEEKKEEE